MSELYVKILALVYEFGLLSNSNYLPELRNTRSYCGPPSVLSPWRAPSTKQKRTIPMKRYFQLQRILLLVILSIGLSSVAIAQELTGVLTGTVKDANGAAVQAATVTITDTAKKLVVRTVSTDEDGSFTATDLHVGLYDV